MPIIIIFVLGVGYAIVDIYWRYTDSINEINDNAEDKINQIHEIILNKKIIFDIHENIVKTYQKTEGMTEDMIIGLILDYKDSKIFENEHISRKYAEYIFYTLIEGGYIGKVYYGDDVRYIPIPL
jgi:hypothetical protein